MTTKVAKEKDKNFQEEVNAEAVTAAPSRVQVLSTQDTEISDLVSESVKTLESLEVRDSTPYVNLLELPDECAKLHKVKYRFRWIAKDKNTAARVRSSCWELCTRTNAPFIRPHRFKSHGAVEQAGMLLAFCTEEVGQWREELPAKKSAALVKHYTEELPQSEARGFYKPADSGDNETDDGLLQDRDF